MSEHKSPSSPWPSIPLSRPEREVVRECFLSIDVRYQGLLDHTPRDERVCFSPEHLNLLLLAVATEEEHAVAQDQRRILGRVRKRLAKEGTRIYGPKYARTTAKMLRWTVRTNKQFLDSVLGPGQSMPIRWWDLRDDEGDAKNRSA